MEKLRKYRYPLCFLALFALCWLFPYMGDDWAWGSSIGIERLVTWFDNYNGRYAGNLIVLALTRSNLLKTFSMAFCLVGLIACIEKMLKQKWAFLLAGLFLLFTPKAVVAQSIVWTSGFANYTTSIFFVLLYITYTYWIFSKEEMPAQLKQQPLMAPLMLILGAVSTTIMEHITIYCVVLGLFVLVFVLAKYRKVLIQHIFFFVGSVAGAAYMFSNSAYHAIAEDQDGYRTMATGIKELISRAFTNYINVIYEQFYMNNLFLNAAILVVSILVFTGLRKKLKNNTHRKVMEACIGIMSSYMIWSVFSVVRNSTDIQPDVILWFEGLFTIVAGIAMIVFVTLSAVYYKKADKILFIVGSLIFIAAPLLVVTPIGARCFFATYVLFILLLGELCNMTPAEYKEKMQSIRLTKVLSVLSLTVLTMYFCMFIAVDRVDKQRLEYVREQAAAGKTQIEILRHPYESYLWCATPNAGNVWEVRYKLFYGLPENITLIAVNRYSNIEQ